MRHEARKRSHAARTRGSVLTNINHMSCFPVPTLREELFWMHSPANSFFAFSRNTKSWGYCLRQQRSVLREAGRGVLDRAGVCQAE